MKQVQTLESMIGLNKKSEQQFLGMKLNVDKIDRLKGLMKDVEEVEGLFGEMENLIDMQEFEDYLEEIKEVSKMFKEGKLRAQRSQYQSLFKEIKENFEISGLLKTMAITIVILSFLLLVLIIRKINYKISSHTF